MPKAFESCVKAGGKVRTMQVKGRPGKYMHICVPPGGKKDGHSVGGEVHTKKKKHNPKSSHRGKG